MTFKLLDVLGEIGASSITTSKADDLAEMMVREIVTDGTNDTKIAGVTNASDVAAKEAEGFMVVVV